MDRGGGSTQGRGSGADGLGAVIEAVVGMVTAMRPLRRECDRLLARHAAGLAGAEDLHRYQMTRLRLTMLESSNRGVGSPPGAADVLAERSRLDFHALVDRRDQFPEPQPS